MIQTTDEMDPTPSSSTKKAPKRGIIYLSMIPPYMNVLKIREYFGQFGTLGRVYLEIEKSKTNLQNGGKPSKTRKIGKKFTEGWIEFERKSVAKKVTKLLNNSQVNSKKKSKQYDSIWNIKYLSGFKWSHLHERLNYEKAARRQRIREETQSYKKKGTAFSLNISEKKKKTVTDSEF